MEWELLAYLSLSLSNKRLSKERALDEHLLIQKYFSNIGSAFLAEHNVEVSIGDDASVISSNKNHHLVINDVYYIYCILLIIIIDIIFLFFLHLKKTTKCQGGRTYSF